MNTDATSLTRMPTEVLEIFIRAVLRNRKLLGPGGVTSTLRVCRRWHDVGVRLLWTNVSFSHQTLCKFVQVQSFSNFSLIRSLAVIIAPIDPLEMNGRVPGTTSQEEIYAIYQNGNSKTREVWHALRELPSSLSKMSQLTTFSFRINGTVKGGGPYGFWFAANDIYNLIECLPAILKNLELDTHGFKLHQQDSASNHCCTALASRLPALEHCRLRMRRFCPQLVPKDDMLSNLRTLDLNIVAPYHFSQIKPCGDAPDKPQETGADYVSHASSAAVCDILVKALKSLPAHAPTLQRLQVIDAQNSYENKSQACISKLDLLTKTTTTCPIEFLNDREISEIRLPTYPMLNYTTKHTDFAIQQIFVLLRSTASTE